MAKIKKIKRDLLAELGDEFEVLSDAEAQESGIELTADEVIIVAKPAPPTKPSGGGNGNEELDTLRSRLHTVNEESASRRIKLREFEEQFKKQDDELKTLKQTLADRELADTKEKAKVLFTEHVKDKKLEFISAEAGEDVRETVFQAIDWSKPVTKEVLGPAIDGLVEKKKYVLKTVQLGGTGAGERSSVGDGTVDIDLAAIASEFNIPFKESKKES